ncbi:MAG: hypothetical protein AVDCRST_MAG79-284, partial [uncultured Thermoleophilia bacterium]
AAVVEAVATRSPTAAGAAMRRHLDAVRAAVPNSGQEPG